MLAPFQAEVRQSCSEGLTAKRMVAGHRERVFSLQRLSTTPGTQQAGPAGLGESYFSHAVVRQSLQCLPCCPLPIPAPLIWTRAPCSQVLPSESGPASVLLGRGDQKDPLLLGRVSPEPRRRRLLGPGKAVWGTMVFEAPEI